MDNEILLFEYPLKENIRRFLRLESLFKSFKSNTLSLNAENHLHALKYLFEILEMLETGDSRSELIKELARYIEYFKMLKENPNVEVSKLDNFLNQLTQLHYWTLNYEGKFGEKLRKDSFINSVKQRTSIPGGNCQFDCPDLFLFMNQNHSQRQEKLNQWVNDIKGVETSINVILRLIRDKTKWSEESAPLGNFMLDLKGAENQLIRIKLTTDSRNIFPEFSSGKHRSNVHFMRFNDQHKKSPINQPIKFELACC
ncbi:MAG: cell division protein ZapD [Kangiella sp.]|nr:MAG: cell division protein ZapD [Kangiella sp.]